ncbi:hypothetical protein [Acinetobacter venetianus]|uniref:hypothetical protein n=1 Tax=Acinetobacter venetianus TaxID=52133 RepID=UPI0010231988|nr:hypothetical protein [Acinetobacter venetianus]RZG80583.1 hypothetical protein EXE23_11910 [Acinetobacter venetianus]
MRRFKSLHFAMLALGSVCLNSAYASSEGLQSLSDSEMSATTGQALMSLSYIAPTDSANLEKLRNSSSNVGFYKLGLEAKVELNANIKNLQLGCGGANGVGGCDIDIKNLSLSGLNDGTETGSSNPNEGSPTFSNGRASTSAELTNPFMEFAIKNPDSASTREFVGLRLSAEKISGLLTAGIANSSTASTTDGIQSLSGYMQIAGTTGDVWTQATTFGKSSSNCMPQTSAPTACQSIAGKLNVALFGRRDFVSLPADGNTSGISIPSMNVGFTLNPFTVNGKRQTKAVAPNVTATIPEIAIARVTGCSESAACNDLYRNDQLAVSLRDPNNLASEDCVLWICTAKFKMGAGSKLTDLNIDITFQQSLSMIHNIPLKGTGGYLSLQKEALQWPGANADDVAQSGWWMSFAEPVQLGYLKASQQVDISNVLPQVATFVTQQLYASSPIDVNLIDALGAAVNQPITKTLVIPVSNNRATLMLENQQLKNQSIPSNCYGGNQFC